MINQLFKQIFCEVGGRGSLVPPLKIKGLYPIIEDFLKNTENIKGLVRIKEILFSLNCVWVVF